MSLYRKKPVVVEAMQFTDESKDAVFSWARGHSHPSFNIRNEPCLLIQTLEGEMRADLGDWVIRGVRGEFYPYKNEVFLQTYDPADQDAHLLDVQDGEAT